jgi:hypothetical protein
VACELYRESCYFSLLALGGGVEAYPPFTELWDAADPSLMLRAAGSGDALAEVRTLAVERSFVDFARSSPAEQARAADLLRRVARELLSEWERPEQEEEQSTYQRRLHLAVGLGILLLALEVGRTPIDTWLAERGDLARGKPWQTSSEWARCVPAEHTCGGTSDTDILFHTREEQSPWFEVDLGKPLEFTKVYVRNREDCCQDRAVPLVVEVSSDRRHWKEVARRNGVFKTWTAKFSSQTARWVRLRVDAKTMFHLEIVRVFP